VLGAFEQEYSDVCMDSDIVADYLAAGSGI
jgi:hypothetical protein